MKILSIGNSFSEDAQRYLHSIAKADGEDFYTVNLYVPGCSLELHSKNVSENNKSYVFQENGIVTERLVSIEDGLKLCDWDVVTVQQVSTHSFIEESFYPYIFNLADCIRAHTPGAKLVIQQTWAYAENSQRIIDVFADPSSKKMLDGIKRAYNRAKSEIGADAIIPSGELFMKLSERGAEPIYRDTFHAAWGLGRYALGLLWYRSLTGKSVLNNTFADFDEPVSNEMYRLVRECVEEFGKVI